MNEMRSDDANKLRNRMYFFMFLLLSSGWFQCFAVNDKQINIYQCQWSDRILVSSLMSFKHQMSSLISYFFIVLRCFACSIRRLHFRNRTRSSSPTLYFIISPLYLVYDCFAHSNTKTPSFQMGLKGAAEGAPDGLLFAFACEKMSMWHFTLPSNKSAAD